MNERFNFVSTQFEKWESQFGLMLTQFHSLVGSQQDIIKHLKEHDVRFDEVESTLQGIAKAVDKDALAVVDHEHRIAALEHARL